MSTPLGESPKHLGLTVELADLRRMKFGAKSEFWPLPNGNSSTKRWPPRPRRMRSPLAERASGGRAKAACPFPWESETQRRGPAGLAQAAASCRAPILARTLRLWLPNTSKSVLETPRANAIEPMAWLADTLEKLPSWPNSRIDELLPLRKPA